MSTAPVKQESDDRAAARRALVVVGMHRSGTSAMTRMLSLLGAALPKGLMPPIHHNNESGFWEPKNITSLNDEILLALDSEWDDVFAFRPRQYLSNFDRFYLGRAMEVLEQDYNGAELIVLKDPRVSVLTCFWERVLREAGYSTSYVIMVRNPLEVAESLRERDGFPREKSLLLWSSYMLAAERDTRGANRIFVSYSDLIDNWRSVRSRVEHEIALPFPRDTAAAALEIDRFLDRHLCHHHATSQELFSRSEVPDTVKTLYRILAGACEGEAVDHAAVDTIGTELAKMDLLLGPLFADLRGRLGGLSRDVSELTDAHAAARQRGDFFEEQLAAERRVLAAEAAKAAQSIDDYEARLFELGERVTATEDERKRLEVEVEAKTGIAADLVRRLSAAEAERIRLLEERKEKDRAAAKLAQRLDTAERERNRIAEEWKTNARALADLAERLTSSEERLAERLDDTAKLTSLLEEARREVNLAKIEADKTRGNADAAARTNDSKLTHRFHEIATLTQLLRQHQERGEEAQEQVRWLLRLNERLRKQPRWWTLLPKPWKLRRKLAFLRDEGIFDGEAYLERYPDVAAARRDPLEHYLEHGYYEGRVLK